MSWKKAGARARTRQEASRGSGMFASMKNSGDYVEFVPLGEVRVLFKTWNQASGKYEEAEPDPNARGVSVRYAFNLYNVEAGAVQILELSEQAFEEAAEEIAENGVDCVYRITRRGTGTDTKYRTRAVKDSQERGREIQVREGADENLHEIRNSYAIDEIEWGDDDSGPTTSRGRGTRSTQPDYTDTPDDDVPF